MERVSHARQARSLGCQILEQRTLMAVVDYVPVAEVGIANPLVDAAATIADLDGDGDRDLLTNDGWAPNRAETATFGALNVLLPGHRGQIIAGDLDGDGDLDLVAAGDATHPLQWLRNDGNANFVPAATIGDGAPATQLMLTDLDHDGDLDIIAGHADNKSRDVHTYLHVNLDSIGEFSPATKLIEEPFTPLHLLDWNQDGRVDLVGNYGVGQLVVMQNGPKFSNVATVAEFTVAEIDVADFDADGDPDFVLVENTFDEFSGDTASRIWVYQNLGSDKLVANRIAEQNGQLAFGFNQTFGNVSFADVDNDGRDDILTTYSSRVDHESLDTGGVVWFAGQDLLFDSESRLLTSGDYGLPMQTGIPAAAIAVDLDGDEDRDVLSVWLDDRVNTAEGSMTVPAHVTVYQARTATFSGDVDGNGRLDSLDLDTLRSAVLLGDRRFDLNADGSVDEHDSEELQVNYLHVKAGDVDGNGVFDSSDLILMFQAGQYEDLFDGNSRWQDGDFNGDGDFTSQDLVFAMIHAEYQ
ncbi:MAG: VCBS repeat-containing protein [Planctomycetales bacterium]|nr:VCBS repeat-containing protein [Planctomycetales bacterium]